MTERITQFTESIGISIRAFEQQIGASNGLIRKAITNKTDIQSKWLSSIAENYPQINIEWLITGKGEMLKKQDPPIHIIKEPAIKEAEETRPRIPMDAAAGSLSIAIHGITMNQCEQIPVIKAFSHYDFTIFVRGDSMELEYHSGDELACLYIKNTSFVQWGRVYVLDTAQGILFKRLFDAEDSILCRSDNERYHDFLIHKSEIYNIALVIGMIRRY